jgi:hypothetical protein
LASANAQKLLEKVQFLEEETAAQRSGAEDVKSKVVFSCLPICHACGGDRDRWISKSIP